MQVSQERKTSHGSSQAVSAPNGDEMEMNYDGRGRHCDAVQSLLACGVVRRSWLVKAERREGKVFG